MKPYSQKIAAIALLFMALQLVGCQKKADNYEKIEPAHLEHIEGSELSTLTLTEKAIERTGIQTAPVTEELIAQSEPTLQKIVPYAAVIYDAHGHIWVYTNPEPRVYVRHEIKVDYIEGDKAVLLEGPPAGTKVVTAGAAELYGTEYEVGH